MKSTFITLVSWLQVNPLNLRTLMLVVMFLSAGHFTVIAQTDSTGGQAPVEDGRDPVMEIDNSQPEAPAEAEPASEPSVSEPANETSSEPAFSSDSPSAESSEGVEAAAAASSADVSDFRPIISLGGGVLTYFGDVSNSQKANGPLTSNMAVDLSLSFPLRSSFYITFRTMLGKVSANERSATLNRNFQSRISTFGLEVSYNFNHFLNQERRVDPFLSAGFDALIFNSKTDLMDTDGNVYHYWSDGSIKDLPENDENKFAANNLQRDYLYETDIRKSNISGVGYYEKYSFAVPVGAGVNMRLSPRFHAQLGASYYFLLTDLVDGVSSDGKGDYKGNGGNDGFLYSHVALSFDLSSRGQKQEDPDMISKEELAALVENDDDADGVQNLQDECPNTPAGVEVLENGCPADEDNDGVPDYMDMELGSAEGAVVDSNGVTLTDEQLEQIYLRFLNASGQFSPIEDTIYAKDVPTKTQRKKYSRYSVQIAGDQLTDDQAGKLLSEPEIKSVKDGSGDAILVGSYSSIEEAMQKNREMKKQGFNTRAIVEETVTGNVQQADLRGVFVGASAAKAMESGGGTVFRIQVGAFSKPISDETFGDLDGVVGVKGNDGLTRYYTGSYRSYDEAAAARVGLKAAGYGDCLIKAFKEGEQVTLASQGATFVGTEALKGSADKSKVKFKIQLGSYKENIPMEDLNKFVKLGNVEHSKDADGLTRYFAGRFSDYNQATAFKNELDEMGIKGAFIVGEYDDKTITAKEALELLK
jgi:hypothetical protein